MPGLDLTDPVRLSVSHALFRLAYQERAQRSYASANNPQIGSDQDSMDGEATQLFALLQSHFASLDRVELDKLCAKLAHSLLIEFDRNIAASGQLPGVRLDPACLEGDGSGVNSVSAARKVALVSLPWMSPALPSIQLATLASDLQHHGIDSDVHELYVDYAARIGLNLYNYLGNLLGFLPEWIFSRHYYREETGEESSSEWAQELLKDSPWPEFADVLIKAFDAVTESYLDEMIETGEWHRYDIVGCSLTISQLGSSMAFARRLKLRHPQIKIVFGGSQCAGPMGRAILRICPYVDVVVHVEGELVLGELVQRCRQGRTLEGMGGISYRSQDNRIVSGPPASLYREQDECSTLRYDSYFQRLIRLNLFEKMNPWLPFESSRGCWYGQKTQCTFCGLHEIMEFRSWKADAVLNELERLYSRYGIPRFYAVDLILPRDYFHSLLPEIARKGHDWMFFWEVKANMRREEIEMLAAAGVRWVQPGIESLDEDMLRLMRKGVSPLQNILLLKWSEELGIYCGWNMIHGLPGEKQQSYDNMVALIPKLYHLTPPNGAGRFQLHRFSPYFQNPAQYGIRWTGAHPMFRHAFPVSQEDLDELVYLHDFESLTEGASTDGSALESAIAEWRRAYQRGAALRINLREDGSSYVEDERNSDDKRTFEFASHETALYLFLDGGMKQAAIAGAFCAAFPDLVRDLNGSAGIDAMVESWLKEGLVLAIDGRVVALATRPDRNGSRPDLDKSQKFVPIPALKSDTHPLVSIDLKPQ